MPHIDSRGMLRAGTSKVDDIVGSTVNNLLRVSIIAKTACSFDGH